MKKILTAIALFISLQSVAQKATVITEIFIIEESIKLSQSFSLNKMAGLPVEKKDSIVIFTYLPESKSQKLIVES